ncbi:MAG: 50S ribosomal protein L7/L12 [Trueperaceae bacterium]|nr:50S ribosomal protein L7/L12 [Trueperaceae bacterium]
MAFDKDAMIEQLSGLTVLELVDLVEGLKEKWGVEAAAAMPAGMMMAAPAAGGEAAAAAEEQTEFTVSIKDAGASKLQVIKVVREVVSGLGLKEAKELVESNGVVKEGASKEEAADIKTKLEAAGATVEVK